MTAATYEYDPDSEEWYEIDWTGYAGGKAITLAVWTLPAALTKLDEQIAGFKTRIKPTGGTPRSAYRLTCHATFADATEEDQSIILRAIDQ